MIRPLRPFGLAAALLALPCLAGAPAPTAEADFWAWFAKNEARLADAAKADPVGPMNEISDQLAKKVNPALIAELAIDPRPGQKNQVVITADGDRKLFGAVKTVAAAAPKLERWTVVAFRQRRPPEETLELSGHSYKVGDFSFREVGRSEGKLDVEIFARGAAKRGDERYLQAAFILLDGIVGEYDMETKVGGITLTPVAGKPPKGARPLPELAALVDSL